MAQRQFRPQTTGRHQLEFFPAPKKSDFRPFAAIVIPWVDDSHVLLCNISNRGWVVPSGRLEAGETSREAALREAREEACAKLSATTYIGCYRISDRDTIRWAELYVAKVEGLDPFVANAECSARRIAHRDALPKLYYEWNELLGQIFDLSHEIIFRPVS